MKNLSFKICLVIASLASTPSFSGVGDVYYCTVDFFGSFSNEKKILETHSGFDKFMFKQNQNTLEFDDGYIFFRTHNYEEKDEIIVTINPLSNHIWFDGKKFTLTISQSENLDHFLVFATCSTF
ncbi:hypothetical protein N9O21_00880 [Rhodobacteraceae bacterium]|nr:hypothetical protein [Paracoccaceae bacterium]